MHEYIARSNLAVAFMVFIAMTITACSRLEPVHAQKKRDHIIIDRLENAERYYDMHPAFKDAFAFLRQQALAEPELGKHNINGDKLFCTIAKETGRSRAEAKLEAHRRYIDIQYVIDGAEEMGWRRTSTCTQVDQAYDAEKDIAFFDDLPASWTRVTPGSFVIFFPEDAHAPLVSNGKIHKAVLKILLEQ